MAILSKGTDFSTGDQVTAANLDALVDSATFAAGAVDNTTTALDSSSPQKIIVKNGGIGTTQLATSSSTTTGVTFAKMQHVASGTVLANSTSSEGDISALTVADTKIIIGNGSGLTSAALSGDATMTNGGAVTIANDAVTLAKMQNVAANTVLVRDASSEGNISAKAVTNTQILIGDGTGFTAAALSGDATMTNGGVVTIANDAVTTAKIDDDAVTLAKIENVAANTVLVRNANSTGDISAKAVANTQILIGDGTGFTAAALSGDATMTNAGVVDISNDVALGGSPTTTTQSAGNNTTRVATTAFVTAAVAAVPQVIPPFNRLRLKMFPSKFGAGFTSNTGNKIIVPTGGLYSSTDIPAGYKATHFTLSTQETVTATVYESQLDDDSLVEKGSAAGSGNTTINMTDVTGSNDNYLVVKLITTGSSSKYYLGGYFTIAAV